MHKCVNCSTKVNISSLADVVMLVTCWQVLVSSDGKKSSKLANIAADWLQRIANDLGKYSARLYTTQNCKCLR